ncbi:unnamed protein product [Kuraishia capsulata CBS 1993]|uniref:SAGA-associated factor 11 n=1 Tax=Kuraishia capsulata CBS 1993 TaxID=1382522 RepID=W6MRE1_9ASCO|nr:uncharacterized protein KUCA_T00000372001 [Kuraishia capsulata CBS 1993]CDK24410.1 unnamed protein product [Kuraishia capsulata CBS 1993]
MTNTQPSENGDSDMLTYRNISSSILENMFTPIIHEIIIESILNEQVLRSSYGTVDNPKYVEAGNPTRTDQTQDTQPATKKAKLDSGSSSTSTPTPHYTERDLGRLEFVTNGKDVFSNYKRKENGSANGATGSNGNHSAAGNGNGSDDYFKCLNCDRRIAGSRFASHIDRCLGGRTRK